MATTVQVSPEDRAAAAATTIRTQYVSLVSLGDNLKTLLASTNGFSQEQLKAALGADFETIQKALAGLT